jgi:L-aspartate oxidase
VLDSADSTASHVADTLDAGAGLCDEEVTRTIVEHGREAIGWLIEQGVPFTRDASAKLGYHLTREGGHSARRIIHAADATGHAVQTTLEQKVRSHPNITLLEQHIAIDLIKTPGSASRCVGVYVQDVTHGRVVTIAAGNTVLATGGAGKVYLYTTNPDTATGDGIAMAWRAGCRVANMEFIQFHPTCLYHPYAKSFLISEAVRGEGGLLRLPATAGAAAGHRFMPAHDSRAELAPRDIVARAIDYEMKKRGQDHVDLDISHQPPAISLSGGTFSDHPRALPGLRHRYHYPAHPGGAGRALHLRRHRHRYLWAYRPARPVCSGRNRLHRPAWRQPPSQQLAAGMLGVGPRRCRRHHAAAGRTHPCPARLG